ncbi:23S rRNA (cytidine1920-2'-O)/16S rRNA (cytidine1409-2'-O)-methyltransferase [Seinonella peptonophila]|uniref:23S rRNA (Cytidine1920-2'-O)/16S rRNA (Cytidine1409-2'-O)-methyltransferase n=1 Tax=Seinonella peptonophila TaxID=112248 RepID=A0A1M4TLW1_9BACL|nr:TlyA family RNA methyltransferase [Seinonella peptonophila]SHE45451.1 23S rRNA (cytidine1920-2'-O)/16S rRNA (cytidine1409-2'-O)-methyltransferase [Seinonella peptonophila]
MSKKRQRLEQLLVERGIFETLDQANRLIKAGQVFVNQEVADKPGMSYPLDVDVLVKRPEHPYVSRGGIKLEKALSIFDLSIENRIVLDIGASTGGFTDCALQHGANYVYAVDVGYGQLAWKLRQDERVVILERTNFRYLSAEQLAVGQPDIATIDVSFISLRQILPNLLQLLAEPGDIIALIKPQFEAEKNQVGNKGIISDPKVHLQVLQRIYQVVMDYDLIPLDFIPSPILGGKGNIEFLGYFRKGLTKHSPFPLAQLSSIVEQAHQQKS